MPKQIKRSSKLDESEDEDYRGRVTKTISRSSLASKSHQTLPPPSAMPTRQSVQRESVARLDSSREEKKAAPPKVAARNSKKLSRPSCDSVKISS